MAGTYHHYTLHTGLSGGRHTTRSSAGRQHAAHRESRNGRDSGDERQATIISLPGSASHIVATTTSGRQSPAGVRATDQKQNKPSSSHLPNYIYHHPRTTCCCSFHAPATLDDARRTSTSMPTNLQTHSLPTRTARPPRSRSRSATSPITPSRSSLYEMEKRVCWSLPRWLRKPLWAWLDKLALVLSKQWVETTLLVWAMWGSMSLGESGSPAAIRIS